MPIESYLFRGRVGVYNFNLRSFKQKPNRHCRKGLFTMPVNKSLKIPFFKLLVFSLVITFLNSSFILRYRGTSESMTNSKLTFPDYMLTIMYLLSNFKHLLLLLSGDIEVNPGPKRSSNIKFGHWNINGVAAHDFIKVPLIKVFIKTSNFDIVCLSETLLDSTIPNDNETRNENETYKQEVRDDLNVCVLNILPKDSSLSSLFAVNLTEVQIQIFQIVVRVTSRCSLYQRVMFGSVLH